MILWPLGSWATQGGPEGVAITPNGSFLYVANAANDTISIFAIGSDGLLTLISAPPVGSGPFGIAITPDGSVMYVANEVGNTISAFAIGADGLLTTLSTPTFPATGGPIAIVLVQ